MDMVAEHLEEQIKKDSAALDDEVLFKLVEKTRIVADPLDVFKFRACLVTKNIFSTIPPQENDGPSVPMREEDFLWKELEKRADFNPDIYYTIGGQKISECNIGGDEIHFEGITMEDA